MGGVGPVSQTLARPQTPGATDVGHQQKTDTRAEALGDKQPGGNRPRMTRTLQNRAREWRREHALPIPPPGMKKRRFRVVLWSIEAILLLAAAEHFLLRPAVERRRRTRAVEAAARTVAAGPEITPLGNRALPLRALTEVATARYAPVERLAAGSLAMRNAQQDVAETLRLPVETVNTVGIAFRLVPAGTAVMGSPESEAGRGACEVRHVTSIPAPFYLGKYEITQAQWRQVMGASPAHFTGDERPVEEVTWYDCQRFLVKLRELENVSKTTYRLPTEAEWEYACRAGTSTAFCFGNDPARLGDYADYAGNNYQGTNEVGKRLPNALGLYDMHGNVWEWCLDLYRNYPGDESAVGDKSTWRCLRGGNWYVAAPECRSANRCRLPPASQGNMLGFRIVRTIPEVLDAAEPGSGRP